MLKNNSHSPATIIIAIALTFILSSCVDTAPPHQLSSTAPPDPSIPASPVRDLLPKWELLVDGSDLRTDVNFNYYPQIMKLSNDTVLGENAWNGFLKKYIESLPIEKRDDVLKGLTKFDKQYDKVEKSIKFGPPIHKNPYGPYSSNSYISLKGSLTKSKANAYLEVYYYGSSWIFANRITVVADDFTWKSPELTFYRDNYTMVWEYTYLDLMRPKYRRIADKIISSKEAIIRFHGNQYYDDLHVTKRMKQDISEMLRAIDAINGKS